jgi:hypothetical protein
MGPYIIPSSNDYEKQTLSTVLDGGRQKGAITNVPHWDVQKPCTSCMILSITAGLEHTEDGSDANVNSGLMLHHMVLMNAGNTSLTRDATCSDKLISLPEFGVHRTQKKTERIFASGNERATADMTAGGKQKVGYYIAEGNEFMTYLESMNMNPVAKSVYLTLTYDFIDGPEQSQFKRAKPIWMDVDNCKTSEVDPPEGKTSYVLESEDWTTDYDGEFISGFGHVHDGGTNVIVSKNGVDVCNSVSQYGTKPEYIEPAIKTAGNGSSGHAMSGMQHVSVVSQCDAMGAIKKGDKIKIRAYYNTTEHMPMLNEGKASPVMGIAVLYSTVDGEPVAPVPPKQNKLKSLWTKVAEEKSHEEWTEVKTS